MRNNETEQDGHHEIRSNGSGKLELLLSKN